MARLDDGGQQGLTTSIESTASKVLRAIISNNDGAAMAHNSLRAKVLGGGERESSHSKCVLELAILGLLDQQLLRRTGSAQALYSVRGRLPLASSLARQPARFAAPDSSPLPSFFAADSRGGVALGRAGGLLGVPHGGAPAPAPAAGHVALPPRHAVAPPAVAVGARPRARWARVVRGPTLPCRSVPDI